MTRCRVRGPGGIVRGLLLVCAATTVWLWCRSVGQTVGSADVVVVRRSANECAYALSLSGWIRVGLYYSDLGLPRERDANNWGWHTAIMALSGPVPLSAGAGALLVRPCYTQILGVLCITYRPATTAIGSRAIAVPHWLVAVACSAYPVTQTLARARRRARRRRRGLCVMCGYDLRGNESQRCPECGTPYSPARMRRAPRT